MTPSPERINKYRRNVLQWHAYIEPYNHRIINMFGRGRGGALTAGHDAHISSLDPPDANGADRSKLLMREREELTQRQPVRSDMRTGTQRCERGLLWK
jgi:hypothetical protein